MVENQGGSTRKKVTVLMVGILFIIGAVIGCGAQKQEQPKQQEIVQEGAQQTPGTQTGDRQNNSHSKMGISCDKCHPGSDTQKKPSTDQCLSCHKSMQEVALKTKDMEPNPHGPHHYDTADCTVCHSIHGKSQMMCSQCHDFKWIQELGDNWNKQ